MPNIVKCREVFDVQRKKECKQSKILVFSAGGDVGLPTEVVFFAVEIARVSRAESPAKKPLPALPKINFGEGKEKKKR